MLAILPLILSIAPEIARWIGGGQAGRVTSSVAAAVKAVTGTDNPTAAAAAINGDPAKAAELRVQLAKISADAETAQRQADLDALKAELADDAAKRQTELDTLKASFADVGSARDQTLGLAKVDSPLAWGAPVLSVIIILAFSTLIFVVLEGKTAGLGENEMPLANVLLGTLAAMATQVANYWLGSSSGSSSKDALLSNAQERLSQSVPAHMLAQPAAVVPAGSVHEGPEYSADQLNALSLAQMRAGRP